MSPIQNKALLVSYNPNKKDDLSQLDTSHEKPINLKVSFILQQLCTKARTCLSQNNWRTRKVEMT